MNKTDAEIIKGLECHRAIGIDTCDECPYTGVMCSSFLTQDALDYINRLKAENERLNKEVDRLSQCVMYHDGQIADAIKEFWDELKARNTMDSRIVSVASGDNLVKEMTENEGKE